ncbi:hypothetical protein SAMN05421874_10741 [Nonomuraea maritima]|uniref:Alpha amylase inhibitor n=1 Tax=Nonomuraea maritima TaxID=683260 RepID=A0A1G9B6R7_9ACTN|nr:hypothetical protein [Nonomuraea maritima]SDK35189.1 hypothetical protein SAMN05421874_10741 [Nonomuraea maritima]
MLLKKLAMTAATMVAVWSVGAATAPASYAASPEGFSGPVSPMAEVASCVSRTVYTTPYGWDLFIQNRCSTTQRVKVIVDWGGDSDCISVGAGQNHTYSYDGITGSYGHLHPC